MATIDEIDIGAALIQLFGPIQQCSNHLSRADMDRTWYGLNIKPTDQQLIDAYTAFLAGRAAEANDKAARQAANAVQRAANKAALNGINVATLNANEVKDLLIFVLSELGYIKKLNGTMEVNIPD